MFYELTNEELMTVDGGDFINGAIAFGAGLVLVGTAIVAAPAVVTAIVGGNVSIAVGVAGMAGADI